MAALSEETSCAKGFCRYRCNTVIVSTKLSKERPADDTCSARADTYKMYANTTRGVTTSTGTLVNVSDNRTISLYYDGSIASTERTLDTTGFSERVTVSSREHWLDFTDNDMYTFALGTGIGLVIVAMIAIFYCIGKKKFKRSRDTCDVDEEERTARDSRSDVSHDPVLKGHHSVSRSHTLAYPSTSFRSQRELENFRNENVKFATLQNHSRLHRELMTDVIGGCAEYKLQDFTRVPSHDALPNGDVTGEPYYSEYAKDMMVNESRRSERRATYQSIFSDGSDVFDNSDWEDEPDQEL